MEQELADADVAIPPGLLHVVLTNMIGNAVKFLREGAKRRVRLAGRSVQVGAVSGPTTAVISPIH